MLYHAYYSREHQTEYKDALLTTLASNDDEGVTIPCGALVVVLYNLAKFIAAFKPKFIAVAFDFGKITFRNDLYPEYKQNRKETPHDMAPLFSLCFSLFQSAGCCCIQVKGFEADDVMASIDHLAKDYGMRKIVHVSVDKDVLQLLDGWTDG